jgi:hypothetical protein
MGILAFGGCSIGIWSVGGCAIGGWTLGGCALGWAAVGGCALAIQGAYGLFAAANAFAVGHPALATHANDAAARLFMSSHAWFAPAPWLLQHYGVIPLIAVAPIALWSLVVLRLQRR